MAPSARDVAPIKGRVGSFDERTGVPKILWADAAAAPGSLKGASSQAAARQHLASFAKYYRLAPSQVDALPVSNVHDTGRGAIITKFARTVDGIEVFGEQIAVAMNRDHDVVALTGVITGDVPAVTKGKSPKRAADSFTLDAAQAVKIAIGEGVGVAVDLADLDLGVVGQGGFRPVTFRGSAKIRATGGNVADPTRVKQVFSRAKDGTLVAGYYVETDLGHGDDKKPRYYAYVIGAADGSVLWKKDLTNFEHSYRVWADNDDLHTPQDGPQGNAPTPLPSGLPDNSTFAYQPTNDILVSAMPGFPDPWLPDGATETRGNNAEAYMDLASPDGFGTGDLRGVVSAPGEFHYDYDFEGFPEDGANGQAGVTQLFYTVNWLHDFYYLGGFDEASGNAQASNYLRGGLENDSIRAEAQDYSGTDNANMSTPADGGRPRMQMYVWTFSPHLQVTAPVDFAQNFLFNGWGNWEPFVYDLPEAEIVYADPPTACEALVGDYTGKVVFIDRGGPTDGCREVQKTLRAEQAGAIAVIMGNHGDETNPGVPFIFGQTTPPTAVTIPLVSINFPDAEKFRARLADGEVRAKLSWSDKVLSGDIDNQIVAHEWGHYISNRLVGNGAGLTATVSRGLGEGWGDFHALLMTTRAGDVNEPGNDQWQGVYAMAGYATQNDPNSYYWGIRRFPYTRQLDKNPLRFGHQSDANPLPDGIPFNDNGQPNSQVHNVGTVWASLLWQCYTNLLQDTARIGPFHIVRDRMRDYVVAAYKLTPNDPTMIEARDALFAAMAASDPVDFQRCAEGFATRGAGVFAKSPPPSDEYNLGVVESDAYGEVYTTTGASFTEGANAVCSPDGILDANESGMLRITFQNVGHTDSAGSTALITSSLPDYIPGLVVIPALLRGQSKTVSVPVIAAAIAPNSTFSVTITPDTPHSRPVTYTFPANANLVLKQSDTDNFDGIREQWFVSSQLAMEPADMWHRDGVVGSDRHYAAPSSDYEAATGLETNFLFVSETEPLVLSFKHSYFFEPGGYDGGLIQISRDFGSTWESIDPVAAGYVGLIEEGGGNPLEGEPAYLEASPGWPDEVEQVINLGTEYAGETVLIRFEVGSDFILSSPGWIVDDVKITGTVGLPFDGTVEPGAECNSSPVVNGGPSRNVNEYLSSTNPTHNVVTLDGSQSFDPDGDELTYQWTQVSGPTIELSDATARVATFPTPDVGPEGGFIVIRLVVSDGTATSEDWLLGVNVINTNLRPTANAGTPVTADERTTLQLAGSGTDPDGTTLTYAWTGPLGVVFSSPTSANPIITVPDVGAAGGTITLSLIVRDELNLASTASTVVVTITNVNRNPVADAGDEQSVVEATLVTLDGSGSTDPDGEAVTYAWTAPEGITLSDATAQKPTFTAPLVSGAGTTLTFGLVVTDPLAASSTASTVEIDVTNVNQPPVASAGENQTAPERTVVTLDAGGSTDPDADTLTYAWTAPEGITLSSTTAASPTFTAPEVAVAGGSFVFTVTVSDGVAPVASDTVTVNVTNVNRVPVADAGDEQTVAKGAVVTLDGSGSADPDADEALTYVWTAPAGITLSDPTGVAPTFTAPTDVPSTGATFVISLVVTDPNDASSTVSTVEIHVTGENAAPVADAGAPQTVRSGDLVVLDGSGTDPDEDAIATYAWTAPTGIVLNNAASATPSFTAPGVTEDTELSFTLLVTDSNGAASPAATVVITVKRALAAPVADAGSSVAAAPGATVTLDGSGSTDPNGDALTFAWTQVAGPTVALTGADAPSATFTAPDAGATATVLTFQLVVSNGEIDSVPSMVSVFVGPEVDLEDPRGDGSGCGCVVAAESSSPAPLASLLLLGLPLLVLVRRRRK